MTPEQRARLERELLRDGAAVLSKSELRAALAHIDALAAEKDEAERAFRACARDRERLIAQLRDPAATYAMVQRGDLVLSDVFVANEARYRELGRIAEQAEARATAAEQRVAAMESHYAQLEQANAQTEARLREVEAERDHLREAAGPIGCKPFTLGSGCPCRLCVLERAKEQAEQTAAALREALERIGWHELTWREARDVARAALHGTGGQ